jgi:hypothetical protein
MDALMLHRMTLYALCHRFGAGALLIALSTSAWAEPATDTAKAGDAVLIGSRTEKPDGSTAMTVGRRLPTDWETKVGVDVGLTAPLTTTPPPEAYLNGWPRQDRSSGIGWASVAVPATPFGWDKAALEARIDPTQDQGKLATTLSRSMPIGDAAKVTVQQGYSLTETLANPTSAPTTLITPGRTSAPVAPAPSTQTLTTEGRVSLNILSSDTTFAAGAKLSSTDEKWLRTLSAEQKFFGGPFSLTGSISERATGETDKSVKAGFKHSW